MMPRSEGYQKVSLDKKFLICHHVPPLARYYSLLTIQSILHIDWVIYVCYRVYRAIFDALMNHISPSEYSSHALCKVIL